MPFTDSIKIVDVVIADKVSLSATPSDVAAGKQFIGSTKNIESGTLPVNPVRSNVVIVAGESFNIPNGINPVSYNVIAQPLSESTAATAEAGDILMPKTAWVNGVKITGTIPKSNLTTVRINSGNDVTLPAGYYPDGITIYSLYTDRLDLTGTDAWYDSSDQSLHPESSGYVEGESMIVTAEIYE